MVDIHTGIDHGNNGPCATADTGLPGLLGPHIDAGHSTILSVIVKPPKAILKVVGL